MLCGSHFNLFGKLWIKDMKPKLSLALDFKIFDKKYKIFYEGSNILNIFISKSFPCLGILHPNAFPIIEM